MGCDQWTAPCRRWKEGSILKIDHVGIIVRDLEKAVTLYKGLLGVPVIFEENKGWISAIIMTDSGKLELMQATDENSPVGKALAKRGEGIHHLAIEVDDVQTYLDKAEWLGLTLIDKHPRKGSEERMIGFIHPRELNGVLLEFNMPGPVKKEG
jgi:methylmalonyl-CoA/ethylmalonyl-CoA epimerase